MKKRSVIVSGSDGFVGKLLVKRLEAEGWLVHCLDARSNIDLKDWPALNGLTGLEEAGAVFHLASMNYVPYAWEHPREVYETNILSTLNLLELCRVKKIKKLIFISSYVYGKPQYQPIDENHPLDPFNPYARSKILGEDLCHAYNKDYGIKIVILRPFNLFGVGQNINYLIPSICRQITDKVPVILKDARPKRDYLYVDDMVEALVKSYEYDASDYEIFNLGSGKSYSVAEVVEQAALLSPYKVIAKYENSARKNEVMDTQANIAKASKLLGWQPQVSLQEGLARIMKGLGQ